MDEPTPTQVPTSTPTPTPVIPEPLKPKSKGPLYLLLGGLLVIVALGGDYYFYGNNLITALPATPIATLTPTVTVSPTSASASAGVDGTANWKKYRNNLAGYEIKYPTNWFVFGPFAGRASNLCLEDPVATFLIELSSKKVTGKEFSFIIEQIPPESMGMRQNGFRSKNTRT